MDATLIAALPSTKNKDRKRDPEMSQTKKSNQWYFGMKVHIGVDARSGLAHTPGVTTGKVDAAKVTDSTRIWRSLRGSGQDHLMGAAYTLAGGRHLDPARRWTICSPWRRFARPWPSRRRS